MAEDVERLLARAELEKVARSLSVPTNDSNVQRALETLGRAKTLGGEDRADRRLRLSMLMAERHTKNLSPLPASDANKDSSEDEGLEFTTQGPPEILVARQYILEYSLRRSKARIDTQKEQFARLQPDIATSVQELGQILSKHREANARIQRMAPRGTQSGFLRPVSSLTYNPSGEILAAADWSGSIQLLDSNSLEPIETAAGVHSGLIGGLDYSPNGTSLASGGFDGLVKIHDTSLVTQVQLEGHTARVAGVDYHPSGSFLASASHDHAWRLWDLTTQKSLLTQTGHSKELSVVKHQRDGSIIGTGGLDGICRIWDLRTGYSILTLDRHVNAIYTIDWSPNGYTVATGGGDNNVFVWDLRKLDSPYEVMAHTNVVSEVLYDSDGSHLYTCSYDHTVGIWDSASWTLDRRLQSSQKLLAMALSDRRVAFGGWERAIDSWKL